MRKLVFYLWTGHKYEMRFQDDATNEDVYNALVEFQNKWKRTEALTFEAGNGAVMVPPSSVSHIEGFYAYEGVM